MLALSVMKVRNFTAEDFAMFHPGGQIGRKLIRVKEAMTFRLGENLPVASDGLTVGQVLHEVSNIKRRSGAVILTNDGKGKRHLHRRRSSPTDHGKSDAACSGRSGK